MNSRRFSPRPLHLVFIVLVTVVFYARTVDNYWIKDDLGLGIFTDGTQITWERLRPFFWPSYMESEQFWRPIPLIPGYFEWKAWGPNPAGYHITNMLLHALVGILVYFLANRLTNFRRPSVGFLAALLVMLNPIEGEAVIWVLQRMVLMCAAFSLAALLCRLKGAESGRSVWRVWSLVLLAFALLSKEVAATLPGVFFLIDWLYAPPRLSRGERFRRAVKQAIPAAILLAVYLGCRYAMWGRFDLRYAGLEPMEYARHNRVFELLPRSLLNCVLPVNAGVFDDPLRLILRGAMLTGFAVAVLRGIFLWRKSRGFRRIAAIAGVLFPLTFLPTLPIFWVDDRLFNARFFYEPSIALALLVGAALWLPKDEDDQDAVPARNMAGKLAATVFLLALGVSLDGGLLAFEEGADQVRGIQKAVLVVADAERESGVEPLMVVLDTPSQVKGVPTLEYSLALALKPPLAPPPGVDCIPLLDILDGTDDWPKRLLRELDRRNAAPSQVTYLEAVREPPGVRPLFGPIPPSAGAYPAEAVLPPDGFFTSNDPTLPEPDFVFVPKGPARRFVLRFDAPDLPGPLLVHLEEGKNLRRDELGRLQWTPAQGDAVDPTLPNLWESVIKQPQPHRIPLLWRVESRDAHDRPIGVTSPRRIVVFTVRKPRGR
ncbi:MAG TPA: hypothetical protein ENK43_03780 [Planctomycetes bacterium]|nr:hypothetical protein [Planctomycetota bacterium]